MLRKAEALLGRPSNDFPAVRKSSSGSYGLQQQQIISDLQIAEHTLRTGRNAPHLKASLIQLFRRDANASMLFGVEVVQIRFDLLEGKTLEPGSGRPDTFREVPSSSGFANMLKKDCHSRAPTASSNSV